MSIRSLVENKSTLDYKALTLSLIQEIGINETVNWDAVIPAAVQQNLFGGEILRLFSDHENFANQKDIRTIHLQKGETSQILFLFARLKDESFSKPNIERITKRFVGGQAAERFVVWFFGDKKNKIFKVVLSGKEGKKIVLKSLTFEINQPFYKTYEFILNEVYSKTNKLFVEPSERWQSLWAAFDISVVNKQFYNAIKSAFDDLVEKVLNKSFIKSLDIKKHFTIRLIGRIIFCWFLKKKNIISDNVLSSKSVQQYTNYYREILEKLFFDVFNTPIDLRKQNLPSEIAEYPFLNGGLFEDQDDDYRGNFQLYLPNEWFYNLFHDTLERYNFTIDENSSTNEELAIDPEMLGRIFENLLAEQNPETRIAASDRKVTGSYYTPREIVDFMVEQSIVEYLKANLNSDIKDSLIEDFVHNLELSDEIKPYSKELLDKLNSVKVLDPACGSGAFPIGILQKLLALKHVILFSTSRFKSLKEFYNLKLDTIRNSIYGSDIQPLATELSRLRCWLSLMVDEEVKDIQPLPNLNFKFVTANSLVDLGFDEMLKTMETKKGGGLLFLNKFIELKDKIIALTTEYFHPSTKPSRKDELHTKFKELQKILTQETVTLIPLYPSVAEFATKFLSWEPFNDNAVAPFFSSSLMFGISEGFDIVIGNPPYIKEHTNKSAFDGIRESIYYQGKMDIWYFFACHFLDHLKQNTGILTFIATNNWITNDGAKIFRNKVLKDAQIIKLIDFGDFKIFESASIQTMVLMIRRYSTNDEYRFDYRKIMEASNRSSIIQEILKKMDSNAIQYLQPNLVKKDFINKTLVFSNSSATKVLDEIKSRQNFSIVVDELMSGIDVLQDFVSKKNKIILGNSFRVSQGIFVLNKDEIDQLQLSKKELALLRPYYTTEELRRYYGNVNNKYWIIYTPSSFKDPSLMLDYPNLKKHLDRFQKVITSDNAPYGLHRTRDEYFFKGEKIFSLRKCKLPSFTFTDYDCYVSRTFICIKSNRINLKYLTAILNSSLIAFWLKNKGKLQGYNYQIDNEPLLGLPIRVNENTKSFEILVNYIIDIHKSGLNSDKQLMLNYFENILDAMTYEVYFEEKLKKAGKDIIKYLTSLNMLAENSEQNNQIVSTTFKNLYAQDHPVRNALYYLDSIEEIKIIKESLSVNNSNSKVEDAKEDNPN